MAIRKVGKGYQVDVQIDSFRFRKVFKTKKVAQGVENEIKAQVYRGEFEKPINGKIALQDAIDEFERDKRGTVADKTIEVYLYLLKLSFHKIPIVFLSHITPEVIRKILTKEEGIEGRSLNDRTRKNIYTTLRTFLNWAVKKRYLPRSPITHIDPPKIKKKPLLCYTEKEIEKLLKKVDEEDKLFFHLLYYTGLRAGDLQRLMWEDIHLRENKITSVISKSDKIISIPISPKLKVYLKKYKKSSGKVVRGKVQRILAKYSRRKIIKKHLTAHAFRRSLATNLLKRGKPLEKVRILLAHSGVDVTRIYNQMTTEDVKDLLDDI